ncbi:hypothetical protein [Leptospira meyeri]|uniref:hypothetical protein n=1 Tax=Leptospira meyeri TaxID=29508 RepID=UPI0002BFE1EE|nr:hypothetical protein [Leptospira meyeri]EMJ89138.1 hypothetical protein LEP1GSC196_2599 [Leptospira meyeri serovar Semaranga str. Veldrot Semarang 173]
MKKTAVTILILLFTFQCRIFKPSSLDPAEDIGSLQSLLRLLSLADAFNTYSQTVAFMKFTDPGGNPYINGTVSYSVYNEADENGVPPTPFGESGNVQSYTVTLDSNGRGFLYFSERGIASLTVKNSGGTLVGAASFRIYNGITKQSFSLLTQGGIVQFLLEDIANYRNRLASNATFTPLGSANGRQFIYFEVLTSYIAPNQNTSIGYIASSADGENYDLVTKIDGVTIEKTVGYESVLKISKPVFNGSEYVFFLAEEKRDYSGPPPAILGFRNLALRIPMLFTPNASSVITLSLYPNFFLFRPDNFPWMYPTFSFGNGKYLISPTLYGAVEVTPTLLNSDFSVNQNMTAGFSCNLADATFNSVGFQMVTIGGTEYIHCPSSTLPASTIMARSIEANSLNNRLVTFNGTQNFESLPVFVRGKFVATFGVTPIGYTFDADAYPSPNPTLTRNGSQIPGFTSSISNSGTSGILRSVKSSGNADYFILSSNTTFSTPSIEIFRSIDSLASVTVLPSIPIVYSTGISNAEQLQSANGKLNYSYSISAVTGVGSFPVYLTYFTNDSGTWEALPRLIKIR